MARIVHMHPTDAKIFKRIACKKYGSVLEYLGSDRYRVHVSRADDVESRVDALIFNLRNRRFKKQLKGNGREGK